MPNKTKKTKPKPRKSQPQQLARSSTTPKLRVPNSFVSRVCGQTDPFCGHAQGAQQYTPGNMRTFPMTQHFRLNIYTDANGNASLIFAPNYYYYGAQATSLGPGGDAIYSTGSPSPTTIGVTPTGLRLVSGGIVFRGTSAPLYASGMVHLRSFARDPTVYAGFVVDTYNCLEYADVPLKDATEVCGIIRHMDARSERMYGQGEVAPAIDCSSWTSDGNSCVNLAIIGGPPSILVGQVEVMYHWELIFPDNSSLAQIQRPTPKDTPLLTDAVNYASSNAKSLFSYGISRTSKYLVDHATTAVRAAIAARLGAPAAVLSTIVD